MLPLFHLLSGRLSFPFVLFPPMTPQGLNRIWKFTCKTHTIKLVLICLAHHASDDGNSCHPSISQIAVECCLKRRAVFRAIRELELDGRIFVRRTSRPGAHRTNRYTVAIEQRQPEFGLVSNGHLPSGVSRARSSVSRDTHNRQEQALGGGRGTPPLNGASEKFIENLEGLYPSRLLKLQGEIKTKLRSARSELTKTHWKKYLAAVDAKLFGDVPEDEPAKPLPVARAQPKEPTRKELMEGAQYAISIGRSDLLTNSQRIILNLE